MELYVVKAMGGGNLYITEGQFEEPLEGVLESCGRLIASQPYVRTFDIHRGEPIDVNLDAFHRHPSLYRTTLLDVMCRPHGLSLNHPVEPWIEVPPDERFSSKIVIHRRKSVVRDRVNALFDWDKLIALLGPSHFVFVSRLELEWKEFGRPDIEYHRPADNYGHASAIRGSRLYIGNQSFPSALADALGVDRIFELSYGVDRKHFAISYAPNAWYFASPWDCTIRNFRYLKTNGSFLDLATNHPAGRLEPYHFSWKDALAQEANYHGRYWRFLLKEWIKRVCLSPKNP